MRALVAQGLIFSLLMSGTASAQTVVQATEEITVQAQPVVEQNKVEGCSRPWNFTVENWNAMTAETQGRMCRWTNPLQAADAVAAAHRKMLVEDADYRKMIADQAADNLPVVSRGLGIAGVVTALVGVAILGPWGTPVTVVDTTYCVTDRYDVYEGGCNARGAQAAIGAAVLGGGILMTWAGLRTKKVHVAPSVGRQSVGAIGKVTW